MSPVWKHFLHSCFVVSVLITYTVLCENELIVLLHVTSSHCYTSFLFISYLAIHFHQASQIWVSSVSPNTLIFYILILPLQLLVLFFSNEVHFSSWLLWTFASMPPGNWSYFGWSDHQSMYSGSFFPPWLVIHSTSASYRTALFLSRIRTIACLVCILCLSSLYLEFHFLVSSVLKCVCANFVDFFFLLHLELNFKFIKLIQFLVVHVIVSLVFVLFVLNSCFHKRELFIQTNFILWKTFLHHSSIWATRLSYCNYEQWYTVWQ